MNNTAARVMVVVLLGIFQTAVPVFAQQKPVREKAAPELAPAQFEWSTTAAQLDAEVSGQLHGAHFGPYSRYQRRVTLHDEVWQHFFVFHQDQLIAQGYARSNQLRKPRVGTISDVVSYDNHFWAVRAITKKHGSPKLVDKRTRQEYSEEMGDDGLRVKRSLLWDLRGERFRWELADATIRYTVQYSMDGLAEHRLVNVNPSHWADYFAFQTNQAFRDAGIGLIHRFRRRTKKWVVASFSPSGGLEVKTFNPPSAAKPRSAKRTRWTSDRCRRQGKSCQLTYHYYGGHLYQVDVDFSQDGEFGRRRRPDKVGVAFYKHFAGVDQQLRAQLGRPNAAKRIEDPDNGREMMKAKNLVRSQSGFWSVWYDPGADLLVRHTITGHRRSAGYHIDHKITYRFHNVARSLAEHDAWKAETAHIAAHK